MNKAYEQEIEMWNQFFKECTPVDLRKLDLKVETMFDEALKLFAEKTTNVLDFGCGTGDISTHKVLGIDASKVGIQFANETAKLSEYKTATFLEGGEHIISFRQFAFSCVSAILLSGKRGRLMNIDLREELRKRDELLDGYLKQIEIQEEFIQKQKEMIEFLEDHISKITDIISGV